MKLPARPAALTMLIGAAAMSAAMSAVGLASPAPDKPPLTTQAVPQSRLSVSIGDDIARRDSAAAGQKRALDLREQALKATQSRIDASLKAQQQAQAPTGSVPTDAPDQFDSLAKIYTAMKPAKAAPVFAQLDLEVQYLVARRMRERSTAMILAAMEPQAAARLTMALAGKRPMARSPDPKAK